MLKKISILFLSILLTTALNAKENIMILKLKDGDLKIELFPDVAPNHVKRITELANSGKYDGVVFHRVIDGFMAQTGDVQFGNSSSNSFNLSRAGMGGSDMPDLKEEFNDLPHERGTLSMEDLQILIVQIVSSLYVLVQHLISIDNIQYLEKLLREWSLLI